MEEVDEIVIVTLRQIGCDINEQILSLREFSTNLVISGAVRCLKLINPSLEVSHNVPPSMSARYRLGAALASECTSLGYKGEIGYQTFLYSNEGDLRKLFLFLIEKLPKESEKVFDQPLGTLELCLKECREYFKECFSRTWLPYYCRSSSVCDEKFLIGNPLTDRVTYQSQYAFFPYLDKTWNMPKKELHMSHFERYLKPLQTQIPSCTTLFCSVLKENDKSFSTERKVEWDNSQLSSNEVHLKEIGTFHQKVMNLLACAVKQYSPNTLEAFFNSPASGNSKAKGSRFSHALELQFATTTKESVMPDIETTSEKTMTSEEEKRKVREEETSAVQLDIDEALQKVEQIDFQNKKLESAIQQITVLMKKENKKVDEIKEDYKVKKCTMSLLPDAENNILKLQGLIESSSQRLISLANQWEQHRVPLIEKYRTLKELSSQQLSKTQQKLEEIKQMHDKIRDIGTEARHKDEMHKQLIVSYEKLTKDLNRSAYTRRIMEIVGNIKKQKEEIDKILLDTRNVQKEINTLSGKLERTFTVTDELIFRDAKKDEYVRRSYKLLAALHENCSQLIQITEETGFIVREIREVEDHIEQENQKKVSATLERITSDYKQMQQENSLLIAQLK